MRILGFFAMLALLVGCGKEGSDEKKDSLDIPSSGETQGLMNGDDFSYKFGVVKYFQDDEGVTNPNVLEVYLTDEIHNAEDACNYYFDNEVYFTVKNTEGDLQFLDMEEERQKG